MSQERYADDILRKFRMENCKPISTPMEPGARLSKAEGGSRVDQTRYRSLIGYLRYLCCTRPDLAFGVGMVSRFMEEPRSSH